MSHRKNPLHTLVRGGGEHLSQVAVPGGPRRDV